MIIYLYGADTYRSKEKANELAARFKHEVDPTGLNSAYLNGLDLEISDFEKAVHAPPFLAKKRLVIIQRLLETKKKGIIEHVTSWLPRGTTLDTVCVFWEEQIPTKKGSSELALHKLLVDQKLSQAFNELKPQEMATWIQQYVQRAGKTIAPLAAQTLVSYYAGDTWRIHHELDKLLLMANPAITNELVREHAQPIIASESFAVTDALARGDGASAHRALQQQLSSGQSPHQILHTLAWQCRSLELVRRFIESFGSGYQPQRIAEHVGLHPFVVKKLLPSAQKTSASGLYALHRAIIETDYKLKTSTVDAPTALTMLVYEFQNKTL